MASVRHGVGKTAQKVDAPRPRRLHRPDQPRQSRRVVAVALLVGLGSLLTGCGFGDGHFIDPAPADASAKTSAAKTQLKELVTADPRPMAGYSREKFPHWRQQAGACDTRQVILKRDGTNVTADSKCRVTGGQWVSKYDDKNLTDATQIDIDHVVPLANAWRSGADTWDNRRRGDLANDLDRPQLLAVSATSNRAKGDQNPAQWKPPNKAYWCTYAEDWIAVKSYWQLTVTEAERSALTEMLGTCR